MSKMSLRILNELKGRDKSQGLPEREQCDFSCQERMCLFLDRIGVPRDPKWRTLILYLRSLEDYDILSGEQKEQIQDLVSSLVREEAFTDQSFQQAMTTQKRILLKPFEQKVLAAMEETARSLQEFKATLQSRKGDVQSLARTTLDTIAGEDDPESAMQKIREAFHEVVSYMEEDVAALDQRSRTDALTGLANRLDFDNHLDACIERNLQGKAPLSLVLLDIDHFKRINDIYGHRIGDQALASVGALFKAFEEEMSAEVDGGFFFARYGGEEFALVLDGIDGLAAFHLAEILRKKVAAYDFSIRDVSGRIVKQDKLRISGGVAELDPGLPDNASERLVEAADQALYQAKSEGRNRICGPLAGA